MTLDKAVKRDIQAGKMIAKHAATGSSRYLDLAEWKLRQARDLYEAAGCADSAGDCAKALQDLALNKASH